MAWGNDCLMGALKRFISPPAGVLLSLAVIWMVCLGALIPLHKSASQANEAYQLSRFSAYAFDLVLSLQNELSLQIQPNLSNREKTTLLNDARQRTDFAHHNIIKGWGRFDSSPYGPEFRQQIESGIAAQEGITESSGRKTTSGAPSLAIARPYNTAIGRFLNIRPHVDALEIDDAEAEKLRNEWSSALRLAQALNEEMRSGLEVLTTESPTQEQVDNWRAVAKQHAAFFERLLSEESSSPKTDPNRSELLSNVQKAAQLSDQLWEQVQNGTSLSNDEKLKWLFALATAEKNQSMIANDRRAKLNAKTRSQAKSANVIFIIAVLIATALTIIFLIWQNYRDPKALFLVVVASFNIPFLWWGLTAGGEFLADEGGVLETAQAATLLVALVLFLMDAIKFDQPSRSGALILTCVCLFMFFREMDFRTFGAPEWIITLSSGPGRRILFIIGASAVIIYALRNYRHLLALIPSGLTLRAWPFYVWPILLLLGEGVEVITHATRKDDLHGFWVSGQLWEEILELDAYVMLAYAALIFGDIIRSPETNGAKKTAQSAQREHSAATSAKQPVK